MRIIGLYWMTPTLKLIIVRDFQINFPFSENSRIDLQDNIDETISKLNSKLAGIIYIIAT